MAVVATLDQHRARTPRERLGRLDVALTVVHVSVGAVAVEHVYLHRFRRDTARCLDEATDLPTVRARYPLAAG